MKKKYHYVNNKEFFEHLIRFKKNPEDLVSKEYIGQAFLDIAKGVSNMYNFQNYTYKDDMISEAVLNCYMYMNNFDPEKSKNPFSYFTQIIYYAFVRYIKKEKKQLYIKYKLIRNSNNLLDFSTTQDEDNTYYSMQPNQFSDDLYQGIDEYIQNYEKSMNMFSNENKKLKNKHKSILEEVMKKDEEENIIDE